MTRGPRARAGATKLGCLFFVLVIAAVLYFGVPAGEVYFTNWKFEDAMKQEIRFRSGNTNEQIRAHMKTVADSLGLPEDAGKVTVTRDPLKKTLTIESHYEQTIDLPLTKKDLHFEPRATGNY